MLLLPTLPLIWCRSLSPKWCALFIKIVFALGTSNPLSIIVVDNSISNFVYEPDEQEIIEDLLPKAIATKIFTALLENGASEQGARMSAMDNATRNAGDMIDKLTIQFNRSRQAAITNELIEIISGAEAL